MTTAKPKPRPAASSRCMYGCVDPTTCPWPHDDCAHCRTARKGQDPLRSDAALDSEKDYGTLHPVQ